ncbi:MAG: methionyl-tRNA formyltransferase [Deltaproteobacteria bacterium]|nr:methionyl-tRNA formyltransferase [Deltaproteobacteria bacterium]MBI4223753.1 methionyl-tRNA formyltransferase [Deltaproteobacteria bacterium]
MASEKRYITAGCRPWNREIFDRTISRLPGEWNFVSSPEELTLASIAKIKPRRLFFLHWSWKVPAEIVQQYECVGFHPADLPFGRGGTPVQNLILRGFKETKLSAFRMTEAMDAGPVYLKESLSLEGRAEDIYRRMTETASRMIAKIIEQEPVPVPQTGEVVVFKRRRPAESEIPPLDSLNKLYDFIRMLDTPDYPKAFIEHNGLRHEFSEARLTKEGLEAKVKIRF